MSNATGNTAMAPAGTPLFVYATNTGVLRFDLDGNGGNPAVLIATLIGLPALTVSDIEIIA